MEAAFEQTKVEMMVSMMIAKMERCVVEQVITPSAAESISTPRDDQMFISSSQNLHVTPGSLLALPTVRLNVSGVGRLPSTGLPSKSCKMMEMSAEARKEPEPSNELLSRW